MGRGGKRPGAGAPRGNLNGFKHGRNSQQFRKLLQLVENDPAVARVVAGLIDQNERQAARARKRAETHLFRLLQRIEELQSDLATARYERERAIPPPGWQNPFPKHGFSSKKSNPLSEWVSANKNDECLPL
jgi:CRISPR/Cas system-associated endonuclease Cas1